MTKLQMNIEAWKSDIERFYGEKFLGKCYGPKGSWQHYGWWNLTKSTLKCLLPANTMEVFFLSSLFVIVFGLCLMGIIVF